ncbi:polysaccharide pyruvyl transferase family protein [Nodosilinea sp. E11]|uniref:polysaccharide pyruvyl transferase family protein n=1 Tax=Nodosilinea sp. E11 TaxID=3037479 RepID=UPI00293443EF|nr:polysaccharide pyruvyl transferase family protein [Nodosilinea sp. E11]WOD41092.1 hypothetical protein RRF56_09830 [Nodosilinea sp. E11]
MKRVLIWGFYHQGNLGDDLMAAIFYEILEEIGHAPLIYSANPRFKKMGYKAVSCFQDVEVDAIFLGGGAFFKEANSSNSEIEEAITQLAFFVKEKRLPIFGLSLGSDGVKMLPQVSVARRMIIESQYFQGAVVRLKRDLKLGVRNLYYLPDIVLLTNDCCEKYSRLNPIDPGINSPEFLINLSRRSILHLPEALWMSKGMKTAFFHAHTGIKKTGGEIGLPILPLINNDNICIELGYLSRAKMILSSKLHPGIIAMSFGTRFIPVAARDKVKEFIFQFENVILEDKAERIRVRDNYLTHIKKFLDSI